MTNMDLKTISLQPVYHSDIDNLLADFYLPILANAKVYSRIAGYFCSNALAVTAKGLARFISNGGHINLIANVVLSKEDQNAIKEALRTKEEEVVNEITNLEDEFQKDHIRMLGWMIRRDLLKMKVAVVPMGLEHQKMGIVEDDSGNRISFSGSENETAQGWLHNDEQFHVFRSWQIGEAEHVSSDITIFDRLWNDQGNRVRVYDVSEAFRENVLRLAPKDNADFRRLSVELTKRLMDEYGSRYKKRSKIHLRDYQLQAIKAWVENGCRGIFEMATGTGKTLTALGCVKKAVSESGSKVIVISCPYQHLVNQWVREIENFELTLDLIAADSSHPGWKRLVSEALIDIILDYKNGLIIVTTHDTLSSDDFIRIISEAKQLPMMIVGDEVHGLGSQKRCKGLQDFYRLRVGLSATPRRWFDDPGTKAIFDYFGDTIFEFGLKHAINRINPSTGRSFLTPFRYMPRFIMLTPAELESYSEQCSIIARNLRRLKGDQERDDMVSLLYFKRANIIKNALNKYVVLREIIGELGKEISHTLIYCSPQQIDHVMDILNEEGIIVHRFTMDEGTSPDVKYGGISHREFILRNFVKGKYQALVAMKCLDEGVDVPVAKCAILMSSSGNPREYIQRIGRIVRRSPEKDEATIYDLIVAPSMGSMSAELRAMEMRIFIREMDRYEEIASTATNGAEALSVIYKIKERIWSTK
jgi:superfamily II DNA or RNA helicase